MGHSLEKSQKVTCILGGLVVIIALAPLVGSVVIGFTAASLFGSLVLGFTLNNQPHKLSGGGGGRKRSQEGNSRNWHEGRVGGELLVWRRVTSPWKISTPQLYLRLPWITAIHGTEHITSVYFGVYKDIHDYKTISKPYRESQGHIGINKAWSHYHALYTEQEIQPKCFSWFCETIRMPVPFWILCYCIM